MNLLGFSETEIECDFIPAMALRNEVDVGHAELGLFKLEHLETLHAFAERAEHAFHDMLERTLARIESAAADVAPYELGAADKTAIKAIERLAAAQSNRERR